MDGAQRFVWNKLITGGFRVGVSQRLVVRALARFSGIDGAVIAHRLMGEWPATAETYHRILSPDTRDADISRPYPFFLAYPLEDPVTELGRPENWLVEWKWDGIRGQIIRREGQVFLWSRGEELVTLKYPELAQDAARLPDGTALDGEILPWKDNRPLPFGELQRRIGRKTVARKLLQEVPVIFMVYDIMESEGADCRARPLRDRKAILSERLADIPDSRLRASPEVAAPDWEAYAALQAQSRQRGVEGFILKRWDSAYGVGRRRGAWWKWKVDPYRVDAVLIYAQSGHGRRAGLYTDYTFALWDKDRLVPVAKAYSGLSDSEIRQVDRFVRRNTVERFGPVRSVTPVRPPCSAGPAVIPPGSLLECCRLPCLWGVPLAPASSRSVVPPPRTAHQPRDHPDRHHDDGLRGAAGRALAAVLRGAGRGGDLVRRCLLLARAA